MSGVGKTNAAVLGALKQAAADGVISDKSPNEPDTVEKLARLLGITKHPGMHTPDIMPSETTLIAQAFGGALRECATHQEVDTALADAKAALDGFQFSSSGAKYDLLDKLTATAKSRRGDIDLQSAEARGQKRAVSSFEP